MNAHDEALKIPPPPECESCPHDRREKGGDGRMRYWCASAMPRHPDCVIGSSLMRQLGAMETYTEEEFDFALDVLDGVLQGMRRRTRICGLAPLCPACRTRQVQLIDARPLAKWKCRHCKHKWRFEPLTSISNSTPENTK